MGERLLCKQEVIGSIPFTSTTIFGGAERAGLARLLSLGMKFLFAACGALALSLRFVD